MKKAKQCDRDARQLFRFCLVAGKLDDIRVRTVVQKLIQSKKRGYLLLLNRFLHLLKQEWAEHTAKVESAISMPADLRAVVLDRLAKAYGPAIITLFMQNPDLIGGIRIKVGSDIYDGSVRSTLITLSRKLGITLTSLVGRTG